MRPSARVEILIRFLGQANRAEVPVELLHAASQDEAMIIRRRGTRGRGRPIRYAEGQSPRSGAHAGSPTESDP